MADGDIKFVRIPITADYTGPADTSLQDGVAALFPNAIWDIISTQIVNVTGVGKSQKLVLIVTGRANS